MIGLGQKIRSIEYLFQMEIQDPGLMRLAQKWLEQFFFEEAGIYRSTQVKSIT